MFICCCRCFDLLYYNSRNCIRVHTDAWHIAKKLTCRNVNERVLHKMLIKVLEQHSKHERSVIRMLGFPHCRLADPWSSYFRRVIGYLQLSMAWLLLLIILCRFHNFSLRRRCHSLFHWQTTTTCKSCMKLKNSLVRQAAKLPFLTFSTFFFYQMLTGYSLLLVWIMLILCQKFSKCFMENCLWHNRISLFLCFYDLKYVASA